MRLYYHATRFGAAAKIVEQGFRVWTLEPPYLGTGSYWLPSSGRLGNGIYITSDWRSAMYYGNILLRVSLKPGIRTVDATPAPDVRVLRYLQREFGRDILTVDPLKVLPKNKNLTLEELIALVRYHFHNSHGRKGKSMFERPRKIEKHTELLNRLRHLLLRYGISGFGSPGDDLGMVLFAGDMVVLQEVVVEVPENIFDNWEFTRREFRQFPTLGDLLRKFSNKGTERARALAARVASKQTALPGPLPARTDSRRQTGG